MKGPDLPPCTA